MTGPTYFALRDFDRALAGVLADPEVTGDLLLVGVWLARATILRQPTPDETGWHLADIAADLFPLHTTPAVSGLGVNSLQETAPNAWKVADVLRRDIRRYDVWADQPVPLGIRTPCGSPTARRDQCGKPANIWTLLTDPETGRRRMVGACRKHNEWYVEQRAANQVACEGVEIPRPAANAGGRLVPHITRLDWPALWLGLDPEWVQPPEVDAWERPTLRLLVSPGLAASTRLPDAAPARPRPRFALISGAQT